MIFWYAYINVHQNFGYQKKKFEIGFYWQLNMW